MHMGYVSKSIVLTRYQRLGGSLGSMKIFTILCSKIVLSRPMVLTVELGKDKAQS